MKYSKTLSFTILLLVGFVILALGTPIPMAGASEDNNDEAQQEEATKTEPAETEASALDGGKVYAWNCGACHSERYPKERTDSEWEVIITHMRVRANLTADQAKAVLRYLQENNE